MFTRSGRKSRPPWQNGIVESFVRTLREDLLNFIIPVSQSVVHQRLLEYKEYYNEVRTHFSLMQGSPIQFNFFIPQGSKKLASTALPGGQHHSYQRKEARH